MADFMMEDNHNQYDDVFYLKMVTKKDDKPRFTIKKKVDGKYEILDKEPNSVSGKLKSIEFGEYTWEKAIVKTAKFSIEKQVVADGRDIKQLSIISASYTSTLRSIFNSLLSVNEPIDTISINLYTNKMGYTNALIIVNGKKIGWKYAPEELKKYIEVEKTKKGEIVYYDKLDAFLENEMLKHLPILIIGSTQITDDTTNHDNGETGTFLDDILAD